VDKVWEEWEITRVYAITAAQIRAMGKDPSTVAKLEVSWTVFCFSLCADSSRIKFLVSGTMPMLPRLTYTTSYIA